MKNKRLSRFLAMTTAVAVLTTTVLSQSVVYAADLTEAVSVPTLSGDDEEMVSEEGSERMETEIPSAESARNYSCDQ